MKLRNPASLFVVVGLWLSLAVGGLGQLRGGLFSYDAFGYHLYLVATFIHDDPLLKDLQWVEAVGREWAGDAGLYQVSHYPDNSRVIRYPMGQAVLWSPWFMVGHAIAKLAGFAADGYSMPYQWAVALGVFIYLLLGLLALRSVLLSRTTDRVSAAVLFLVAVGTNLLGQSLFGITMPHALLFALYAGILYFTVEWANDRRVRKAIPVGLLLGLAMLVRNSEVVCVLIPLLWRGRDEAGSFLQRIWRFRGQWSIIMALAFLVLLPQFLYWHAATGKLWIDPYNNPGEGLDLLAPHTGSFLFSFRKGWFVYTPLMLFAVLGIFSLRKVWREAFLPVLVFFVLNLYLLSSWTNWWYAESFGSRAMVGSYAVMALPLAGLLIAIDERSRSVRITCSALLALLVSFNVFQHVQYMRGILHGSRMTAKAYWTTFGKLQRVKGVEDLLLVDRSGPVDLPPEGMKGYLSRELPKDLLRVDATEMDTLVLEADGSTRKAYLLGGAWEFSPAVRIPYKALTTADHAWVELTWHIKPLDGPVRGALVSQMEYKGACYGYFDKALETAPAERDAWSTVVTYYRTPHIRNTDDLFIAFYWSRDKLPVLVDGPHLRVFDPIEAH